jgi:hypothetical protein
MESVVAFLDLLGFSQMSVETSDHEVSQRTLSRIVDALQDSREFTRQSMAGDESNPAAWGLKYFSDNLVLALPLEELGDPASAVQFVIRCVQHYQLRMALNGFFLRGSLTLGSICLTDEIIFGPALVEGYRLQSKVSIVPRVIVAEPIWDMIKQSHQSETDESDASEMICRDVDGWWFVNYLQATRHEGKINWSFIERHKQSILVSLSSTTRHDVLPKFGWACRYHNVFCHWHRKDEGYADRFRIDRVDEQSTIYRLCDSPA